jgi:hypothetical protein
VKAAKEQMSSWAKSKDLKCHTEWNRSVLIMSCRVNTKHLNEEF